MTERRSQGVKNAASIRGVTMAFSLKSGERFMPKLFHLQNPHPERSLGHA